MEQLFVFIVNISKRGTAGTFFEIYQKKFAE